MAKLGKSLLIGATVGVVAAYFFSTAKGKEAKAKASDFITDYKENPEEYNQYAKEKANSYKDLTVEKFNDYKSKYENGNLTPEEVFEQVKEKAALVKEIAVQKMNQIADWEGDEKADKNNQDVKSAVEVDDIVIDYSDDEEA
ncbi:YtxH domain-containing protein [Streptococcus thoraltensis]|uniref:YtxH domain-containing protein n=1 Tax=Streptococcus thoraltensis TaxID=55085 RepID=UPI000382808D|nr:YtxH domain-containing protein [Streptococcus thoraltensis]MDY4762244.1 YtxH domain-containing protein [Streptococcus thoraltensis]